MLVGAWFWGTVSDRIGRRTGFQITIAIFGLASAFAPSALWLAVLRALCGFGLGGALPLDSRSSRSSCPAATAAAGS